MALTPKMKTTVDLHVSPRAARVVALSTAADFVAKVGHPGLTLGDLAERVEDVADSFLAWLDKDTEGPGADEEGDG